MAAEVLKENPALKTELEAKKAKDPKFSANWYAQLDFIYKHSKYLEEAYMEYPVYRYSKK
jgi:hypothetical protein